MKMPLQTKRKEQLMMKKPHVLRNQKDTVFRMLYRDKKELLQLYNALNGSSHEVPEELEVCTLENAIYMNVKNDSSFLLDSELNLYEHQSSFNPNMPFRDLIYIARLLEKYMKDMTIYSTVLLKIPVPRFVVFYNGTVSQPEKQILKLSDAYEKKVPDPELELKVLMLNINLGQNQELMEKCQTLKEYSQYVDRVRKHAGLLPIEAAVELAVTECIREGILSEFLTAQRAEVIAMSIFEYNEEEELKKIRASEFQVGQAAGLAEGLARGKSEGKAEGMAEGKAEGKSEAVLELLGELGTLPAEVRNRILRERNLDQLTKWLKEAAKALSMDDFIKKF